ncbi:MAG: T9SS type A sorting domain-containing protein [Flavobacteriia bacterium]|jgi:hypothetical protein
MKKIIFLLSFVFIALRSYAAIIYVNINATGTNSGTSWANAFTDLQNALSNAFINDDIWVATGTYKPTQTTNRDLSFVMKNGVDIYGGFNGTESSISERNIEVNPTYLSGDIGAIGDNTDNTRKIVKIQNFTAPFTFDGFRVVSGYDGLSSGNGAGIFASNNPGIQLTFNNTILYNNYANHSGGGMIIDNSNTTFNNCEFLYNSSYNYGGGAIYSANGSNSKIYLYDCKFIGNNSRQGAVINFDGLELVMERNLVSSNTSTTNGNIINVSQGPTKFEINNSLIVGNQVPNGTSSIISSYTSGVNSSSLTNVTICHNKHNTTFDVTAEAIYQSNSAMIISNCIIFGNTNSDLNVQIDAGNTVRNSIVENGYSTGTNISTLDPLFVNPGTLAMAPFDATNFDYSLLDGSPAVNYGNNLYAQNFSLDLQNNTRIQQLIVDCGAIESPFTDTQAPIALCSDVTLPLNNIGEATLDAMQVDNNSTDNIGIASYTLSQTAFDCSQMGENSVELTVVDEAGNFSMCTATITVIDDQNPDIQIQNISIYLDENGNVSITTNQIDNGTSDNCSMDTTYLSQYEFTCADSGPNTIVFSALDVNGNLVSSNVIVTVIDSVFPIALAQNVDLYLNASGFALLNPPQVNNGSSDDCGIASMNINQASFNCSDLGSNQVTLSVSDNFGNISTTTANIAVFDTISPITNGQSITVNLANGNPAIITANQINTNSSDNCTFTQTVAPSSFNTVGVFDVILTTTDASGNSSSETYTVTVIDEPLADLDGLSILEFKVFPNPSDGLIYITLGNKEEQFKVCLLDVTGKLLSNKSYTNTNEIEFQLNQAPGIYFLEIETANFKSKRIKVVKI